MKNVFKVLSITTFLIFSQSAYSADPCVQTGNSVGLMGLDSSTGTIYVGVSGGVSSCGSNCASFRFTSVNTDTSKVLDILVAAKTLNKTVRIDRPHTASCNSAYRVYIE